MRINNGQVPVLLAMFGLFFLAACGPEAPVYTVQFTSGGGVSLSWSERNHHNPELNEACLNDVDPRGRAATYFESEEVAATFTGGAWLEGEDICFVHRTVAYETIADWNKHFADIDANYLREFRLTKPGLFLPPLPGAIEAVRSEDGSVTLRLGTASFAILKPTLLAGKEIEIEVLSPCPIFAVAPAADLEEESSARWRVRLDSSLPSAVEIRTGPGCVMEGQVVGD